MNNKKNRTDDFTDNLEQLEERIDSFDSDLQKGRELFMTVAKGNKSLLCAMLDNKTNKVTGLIINHESKTEIIMMLIAAMENAGVSIEELNQVFEILQTGKDRYSIN